MTAWHALADYLEEQGQVDWATMVRKTHCRTSPSANPRPFLPKDRIVVSNPVANNEHFRGFQGEIYAREERMVNCEPRRAWLVRWLDSQSLYWDVSLWENEFTLIED